VTDTPLPTAKTKERTRNKVPESVDVAIVGAGTGGLMAGAYLAKAGLSVALFDPHYVAGGCSTQFHRTIVGGGTYRFDVGLHYIGEAGPDDYLGRMLEDLGLEQEFEQLDPDGYDTFIFPDFRFKMPNDLDLYRQRLLEMFPEEKRGIDKWLSFCRQAEIARYLVTPHGGNMPLGVLLQIPFRAPQLMWRKNASLKTVLDSCTKNIQLQAVLAAQQGDYGLPPAEASAIFHAGCISHFRKGAYYPKGGGQAISDKLADAIEAHGGTIHLKRGISKILMENGRATGVVTEPRRGTQETVRAKAVLSNADIQRTFLELVGPEHLPRKLTSRVQGFDYPSAIFMTFLGVKGDLSELGMEKTNYWQFDGYDIDHMYDLGRRDGPHPLRGAYITSASMKDPTSHWHAPEGVSTLEAMALVPGEPSDWGVERDGINKWKYRKQGHYLELKEQLQQDLIDRAEALFPGLEDRILFKESATPMSHTRYTRAIPGTGYGISNTPDQFADKRPDARSVVKGLYLCGASTRSGMGVIGASLSGQYAAKVIAKDLGRPLKR
jgi:phytoene dehydrogenase-like protein